MEDDLQRRFQLLGSGSVTLYILHIDVPYIHYGCFSGLNLYNTCMFAWSRS